MLHAPKAYGLLYAVEDQCQSLPGLVQLGVHILVHGWDMLG